MGKRVTLQEIADALGISRNTVSRALNNSASVSAETRKKICQMATSMGYKQFSSIDTSVITTEGNDLSAEKKSEIALFTHSFPGVSHSGNRLLEAFQNRVDSLGYKITINIIKDNDIDHLSLPSNFSLDNVAGILCIELFSEKYSQFLCNLNVPILFIDTPVIQHLDLAADTLYMENLSSVYRLIDSFIQNGKTKISFVGDRFHCQSFYERWQAYVSAMTDNGINVDARTCILDDDSSPYHDTDYLATRIGELGTMPEVFFCANDFLAICTVKALRQLGQKVPEDVLVCGFDNAPEATIIDPALTTVKIHSSSMGFIAADILLSRITCPDAPFKKTYVETNIIIRESTGNIKKGDHL